MNEKVLQNELYDRLRGILIRCEHNFLSWTALCAASSETSWLAGDVIQFKGSGFPVKDIRRTRLLGESGSLLVVVISPTIIERTAPYPH